MSDDTKRIIDQPLDTELSPGDLIIVDSEESGVGTRKFDLGTELSGIKEDLLEIYVSGTSLIINGGIQDGEQEEF